MPDLTHATADHRRLSIRPATLEDMKLVASFVRSSADWYRPIVSEKDMAEHAVDDAWARKNFARRDFYVGTIGKGAIGTISLQYFRRYAYLGYIYLDVAHVGKGYGHRLMDFAQGVAKQHDVRGMALIAHPEATWAKKAYLKYGFEIVETDKEHVLAWEDGALRPYYEEGFELYLYEFARVSEPRSARAESRTHRPNADVLGVSA
jgi:GNAT superfamily N-acetyltransferase